MQYLTRDEALKIEPNLGPEVLACQLYPKDASVNPKQMCEELARMGQEAGVKICQSLEITKIERNEDDTYRLVGADGQTHSTTLLILAAGA